MTRYHNIIFKSTQLLMPTLARFYGSTAAQPTEQSIRSYTNIFRQCGYLAVVLDISAQIRALKQVQSQLHNSGSLSSMLSKNLVGLIPSMKRCRSRTVMCTVRALLMFESSLCGAYCGVKRLVDGYDCSRSCANAISTERNSARTSSPSSSSSCRLFGRSLQISCASVMQHLSAVNLSEPITSLVYQTTFILMRKNSAVLTSI